MVVSLGLVAAVVGRTGKLALADLRDMERSRCKLLSVHEAHGALPLSCCVPGSLSVDHLSASKPVPPVLIFTPLHAGIQDHASFRSCLNEDDDEETYHWPNWTVCGVGCENHMEEIHR